MFVRIPYPQDGVRTSAAINEEPSPPQSNNSRPSHKIMMSFGCKGEISDLVMKHFELSVSPKLFCPLEPEMVY